MLRKVQMSEFKKLKVFLTLLLLFIFAIFFFFYGFRIKTVEVEGGKHYSKEEVTKKIIKNKFDENAILLFLKYKYLKQENISFVETVDVQLINKNSVKLVVYEKTIIGCIEFMNEYMYFDKDGIIVETSVEKLSDVPCVFGLNFDHIVLHEKLATTNDELFQTILNITQLIKKYKIDIDKISFNLNEEVALYTGDIRIMLGKRDTYDEQISELKNILPKAKGLKGYFNMRNFTDGQDKIIFIKDK